MTGQVWPRLPCIIDAVRADVVTGTGRQRQHDVLTDDLSRHPRLTQRPQHTNRVILPQRCDSGYGDTTRDETCEQPSKHRQGV